jgi:hypothetical protein
MQFPRICYTTARKSWTSLYDTNWKKEEILLKTRSWTCVRKLKVVQKLELLVVTFDVFVAIPRT